MDECEVCQGQFGIVPVCTVTFTADDTGATTPVRMCRECVTAVFEAMGRQWNAGIEHANAAVNYMCDMLGIEFKVADDDDQDEGDRPASTQRKVVFDGDVGHQDEGWPVGTRVVVVNPNSDFEGQRGTIAAFYPNTSAGYPCVDVTLEVDGRTWNMPASGIESDAGHQDEYLTDDEVRKQYPTLTSAREEGWRDGYAAGRADALGDVDPVLAASQDEDRVPPEVVAEVQRWADTDHRNADEAP